MDEDNPESTPSLKDSLQEIEGGWETPPPAKVSSAQAAADDEDRASTPDLAAVDEGWLDDLFPEADEADEEEEEPEPELPDERLDPEAYALAKKARDERAAARRERKKTKLEAKRARQRARAAEARAKQKGKSKSKAARPKAQPGPKKKQRAASLAAGDPDLTTADEASALDQEESLPARKRGTSGAAPVSRGIATQWKLLALAIAIFVAAAALAAALAR
jgi:hypothetical protein